MVIYLWYTLAVCIFGFNLTLCCLECLSWSQDAWAQSLAPNCQFSHHQSCLSIFFTFVYSFNDICLLCFRTSTWPSLHSWAILNWSHYPNFTTFELIIGEHFIHLCNIFWTPILAIQSFLGASTSWPPLSFLPSNETGSHTTRIFFWMKLKIHQQIENCDLNVANMKAWIGEGGKMNRGTPCQQSTTSWTTTYSSSSS